ncbi:MAG: 1-acyl-sn-glycerol-3-phosphate acyltransferase [Alphaproteobacteria bacterium]|nr:1-acyl-sn-glycerol-3-phosphate acyltransferase [Alphaproteobacteria bacterium]
MKLIRSCLFNVYYVLVTLIICVIGMIVGPFSMKLCCLNARLWGFLLLFGLRWLAGVKCEVKGKENLPKEGGYIIASKHQSALETIAFHALLPEPAYILKKELLYIPLFGWNLKLTGCVPIDRASGTKAMRSILHGTELRLKEKRPVVIFPEGTRTKPGATTHYNPGVGLMYEKFDVPMIPVALNSGVFWRKNAFLKNPGTLTIEFLPAMPKGLDKREFIKELQDRIEAACAQLPLK